MLIGRDIYEILIKGYTEKQWGRKCTELPAFIIKRLPVRFVHDNNYFNDRYQGIPIGGYTKMVAAMLEGVEVRTGVEYRDLIAEQPDIADRIIYCGPVDDFYDFKLGKLEYRSLRFESEILDEENHQGVAVVNYNEREVPWTRIYEYAHFTPERKFGRTIVHREFSFAPGPDDDGFYPIGTPEDAAKLAKYREEAAATCPKVVFGGRLGRYAYWDMDKAIAVALSDFAALSGGAGA